MNEIEQAVQSAVLKSLRQSEQLRAVLGNNNIFGVEPDETMPTPFVVVLRAKEGADGECWVYTGGWAKSKATADLIGEAVLHEVDDCPMLIAPGIVGDVVSGTSETDISRRPSQFACFIILRVALERSAAKAGAA